MAQFASIPPTQSNPFSSYFEQFSKSPFSGFQGTNMEALMEMNSITTRLCSELARQNLKTMNELVQCSVDELHGLSQAKGVEEVLKVLSQSASRISPTVFQHAQNVFDAWLSSATDYNRLIQENMVNTTRTFGKYTQEKTYQGR